MPTETHADLRAAVRDLCRNFPDGYWRELDARRGVSGRVRQGADRRRVSGGADSRRSTAARAWASRKPRSSSKRSIAAAPTPAPATRRCTRWARCCGTARTRRSASTCPDCHRRAAPAGVRRQRADHRLRHDAAQDDRRRARATRYVIRGQKVWISRAEHSDLLLLIARTTPPIRSRSAPRVCRSCSSTCATAIGHGLTIRPIRTMMNHATTELFFDDLEVPASALVGEEGQGLPLSARRAQCRADSDRGRMRGRRPLVHRARDEVRERSASCSAGRSARTRACSFRSRART